MPKALARIAATGAAVPPTKYLQAELIEYFDIGGNSLLRRFFEHPHIHSRHLTLPPRDPVTKRPVEESNGQLMKRFTNEALEMGERAVRECLDSRSIGFQDVDYLCCVTSTGFVVPGLSALFVKEFGMRRDCQRIDVVGMGCHGGLNGLNAAATWQAANSGGRALLVCTEVCSAIYAVDETPRTALVNSLFGDGTAAVLLSDAAPVRDGQASILGFQSHLIPEHLKALSFEWDDDKHRYSFYIDKQTPKILAREVEAPLAALLGRFDLKPSDISHWIVHTGGAAILDALQEKLALRAKDLKHTRSILRDYGNISSGSFLFTYRSLLEAGEAHVGDYGVFMTMGPGLTIEMALVRW